jgi:hypothetical protein
VLWQQRKVERADGSVLDAQLLYGKQLDIVFHRHSLGSALKQLRLDDTRLFRVCAISHCGRANAQCIHDHFSPCHDGGQKGLASPVLRDTRDTTRLSLPVQSHPAAFGRAVAARKAYPLRSRV